MLCGMGFRREWIYPFRTAILFKENAAKIAGEHSSPLRMCGLLIRIKNPTNP